MTKRMAAAILASVLLALGFLATIGCPNRVSLPAPPPPPPIGGAEKLKLYWNLWSEQANDPRFRPVATALQPNSSYRIAVDLSLLQYLSLGALPVPTSKTVDSEVETWLKPGVRDATLTLALLADGTRIEVNSRVRVQDIKVNLKRLRAVWEKGHVESSDDPFTSLEAGEDPEFRLGSAVFDVRTKAQVGLASLAFVVWYQDRPIDEIHMRVCIGNTGQISESSCGDAVGITADERVVNSIRVTTEAGQAPMAAVQFVSLSDEDMVVGVFRVSSWPKDRFLVWQLDQKAIEFRQSLSDRLGVLAKSATDENLLKRGEDLFEELFPQIACDRDGQCIRSEFLKFVEPQLNEDPSAKDYRPPTIFVRMSQVSPDSSLPIPFGLLTISNGKGHSSTTRITQHLLGEYFLVDQPLESQSYQSASKCLERWIILLPPQDAGQALLEARAQLGGTIQSWAESSAARFPTMTSFADWMNTPGDKHASPLVLVTLSHHNRNSLYFQDLTAAADNPLQASKINRHFAEPSVAVLDGCGTAGEGAVELIHNFNRQGFSTVIATHTPVEGVLAGAFLKALAAELNDNAREESIGLVYWRAVRRLSNMKPVNPRTGAEGSTFGKQAWRFTLLGNDNVHVCRPRVGSTGQFN